MSLTLLPSGQSLDLREVRSIRPVSNRTPFRLGKSPRQYHAHVEVTFRIGGSLLEPCVTWDDAVELARDLAAKSRLATDSAA